MRCLRAQPEGGVFTNQIQIEWMCYKCFVLWRVSGSMAHLACVWHEEQFYTAGPEWNTGLDYWTESFSFFGQVSVLFLKEP